MQRGCSKMQWNHSGTWTYLVLLWFWAKLSTHKTPFLAQVELEEDESTKALNELQGIWGVGLTTARCTVVGVMRTAENWSVSIYIYIVLKLRRTRWGLGRWVRNDEDTDPSMIQYGCDDDGDAGGAGGAGADAGGASGGGGCLLLWYASNCLCLLTTFPSAVGLLFSARRPAAVGCDISLVGINSFPGPSPGDGMRWVAAASTTCGVLWRKASWSWTRNLGKTAPERTTHLTLKLFTAGFPVSLKLLLPLNIKSYAFEIFWVLLGFRGMVLLYHSAVERSYDCQLLSTAFASVTAFIHHL